MLREQEDKRDDSKKEDNNYFSSYFDLNVHEVMLKDTARTQAYEEAIKQNKADFQGKVILDVGAGTGILSLFAAKYGASKVYAVEASDMHSYTRLISEINAMDDIVEVIHGKIEEIELPEKVDVIISEWMGFYLLHEAMLDSVLFARDKFLKPGGKMYPSKAVIYAAPVNLETFYKEKFIFWENVYGFDFSVLVGPAVQATVAQPKILDLVANQLLSTPVVVKEINCNRVSVEDLRSFESELKVKNEKDDVVVMHGFGFWFDVLFEGSDATVTLSTAPGKPSTHWKQTIICFSEIFTLKPNDPIECKVGFAVDEESKRRYKLTLEMAGSMMSDEEYDSDVDNHEPGCSCIKCTIIRTYTEQQMAQNDGNEDDGGDK